MSSKLERPNERCARHIVATALGCQVDRHEDGSQDGQVDAIIRRDPPGALEIFSEQDSAFVRLWDALEKRDHRLQVHGALSAWTVALRHTCNVRNLERDLPALLLLHEAHLLTRGRHRRSTLPDRMSALGVVSMWQTGEAPGTVRLQAEGWTGFAGDPRIGEWAVEQLESSPDVLEKLARHPAPEKHAFIWSTIGSDYGLQFGLENHEPPRLPTVDPDLPDPVTHLWVTGSFSSQIGVGWSADRGWWKTWEWPTEPVDLDRPGDSNSG